MRKIVILSSVEILAMKIQNSLKKHGFFDVQIVSLGNNQEITFKQITKYASMIIVDLDQKINDPLEILHSNSGNIPVIFMGESTDVKKIKQIMDLGGSDFILKPIDEEVLFEKVTRLIFQKDLYHNRFLEQDNEKQQDKPTILEWSKAFELGNYELDSEHRSIIDNYRRLHQEVKNGMGLEYYAELLSFLENYVNTHFIHEEDMMKESEFPYLDLHRKLHEEFALIIEDYMEKMRIVGASYPDLIQISLLVKNWLLHHILVEDKKFADHLKNRTQRKQST